MNKHKENIIFNQNLLIFPLFCLIGIIYLGFRINYWFLLLLPLLGFSYRKIKPNKWQIIFMTLIPTIFVPLIIWVPNFSLIEEFNNWFKNITNNWLNNTINSFFDLIYEKETSSFIKLILFNIKSNETYIFLKQTIDLGIVWLISSGGFHLSLISRIINKICKNQQLVSYVINLCFLSIYTFFLGFAYGCLRVLIKNSLKPLFIKCKTRRYDQLGIVGLLICFLNPSCFKSESFLMSFIVCISSYSIINMNLNNKFLSTILINLFSFISIIPFEVSMNNKISILTFINSFVFTYYFIFLFLYFLLFAWMPFMSTIHYWIIRISYVLVGNISFTNIYIESNEWKNWIKSIYYLFFFLINQIIYLIVINNKI